VTEWQIWLAVLSTLVILELVTGTFYLLMIAIGAATGLCVSWLTNDVWMQCLSSALVATVAVVALRKSPYMRQRKAISPGKNPSVHLDIGSPIEIVAWREKSGEQQVVTYFSRSSYRGALWDVYLRAGELPMPGTFYIVEIEGSRLIVAASSANPANQNQ
jgi:membrane protein implicated in regulation of membrane protease activity